MDSFEAQLPATRGDIDEAVKVLEQKISHLPTKEEFFSSQDKLMVELKAIRQEQKSGLNLVRDHEDRIVRLEEHTGIGLPVPA